LASDIYYNDDGPPVLRSPDVSERLTLPDSELSKIGAIILREAWWFEGGSGSATDDWERKIGAQIIQLRAAATIGDYSKAVARVRGLPVDDEPTQTTTEADGRGHWRRARCIRAVIEWQARRGRTIRDLLIVGVVVGVVVFALDRIA
jgi:hypothetical protein